MARQRLQILKKAGLITSQKVYSESKSVYLLAKPGFQILSSRFPETIFAPFVKEVDFRNFDHDTRVNICRIALERSGKAQNWYPERKVRTLGFKVEDCSPLSENIIPDAIYVNSKGERIAVELESTLRKKSRFRFKVLEYEGTIHGFRPPIQKVIFIACHDALGKDLAEIINERKGFFLETYSHFLKRLYSPMEFKNER